MVNLDMMNALTTAADLLHRRRVGLDNINRYIDSWLTYPGWTSSQIGMFNLIRKEESAAVVIAALNMLAAEVTYQHAKSIWESLKQ
jgi:hypothetical protein|nr:MAG TPA: hypothetical protein [Caudoviricetes sp.]